MFNPSNLYAEKVFSEHPTGLWSLDDSADYISLYSDSKANVFTWNVDGGTVSEFTNFLGAPFSDSSVTKILPNLPTTGYGEILLLGDETLSLATLNKQLSTFSISTYIYSKTPYIDHVTIGYRYLDSRNGSYVYVSKNGGHTWQKQTENGIGTGSWSSVSCCYENGNLNLIACENGGYVYVSTDGGATWIQQTNGIGIGNWSSVSCCYGGTNLNLIACDYGGYVYISTDGGQTWVKQINEVVAKSNNQKFKIQKDEVLDSIQAKSNFILSNVDRNTVCPEAGRILYDGGKVYYGDGNSWTEL